MAVSVVLVVDVSVIMPSFVVLVLVLVNVFGGRIEVRTVRVLVVWIEMVMPVDVSERAMNVRMRVAIDGQSDRTDPA